MTSLKGKLASKSSPMTSRQRDKVFSSYSYSCIQNKLNYHLINNESNTEAGDKRGNDGQDKMNRENPQMKNKNFPHKHLALLLIGSLMPGINDYEQIIK